MSNKNKKIALIEPCFFGLGFVDAAVDNGHDIISIVSNKNSPKTFGYEDKFKDLIVTDIRDPKAIIKAIKDSRHKDSLDAIIPGNDYVAPFAVQAAEEFGLKHVSYDSIVKARMKDQTRKVLQENNLPNAEFFVVKNFEEAKMAAKKIGYPVVIKPTDCASSQGVSLVHDEAELNNTFKILADFKETYLGFKTLGTFLVEEYIDGQEFSVEIFMDDGEVIFATVTEKIKTNPPHFVELAHVVPTSTMQERSDELIRAAASYVNALGLKDCASHAEIRISPKGPVVMEINPRPAGGRISQDLILNAFGINVFAAIIDWYLDRPFDVKPKKNLASAIANLVVDKKGIVKNISGLDKAMQIDGIVKSLIKIKQGDFVRPPESNDDRCGYVISVGKTPAEAKETVYMALNCIKIKVE